MNDILGNNISWCSLGTKDKCKWSYRLLAALDLKILVDDIKSIHLLSLVLVKSLYLNIKDRFRVNLYTFMLLKVSCKFFFLAHLKSLELIKNFLVIDVVKELFKLISILLESITDCLRKEISKWMVAGKEPSTEGDSVCLIVEFLRIELVEIVKFALLEDICVDSCNTIY